MNRQPNAARGRLWPTLWIPAEPLTRAYQWLRGSPNGLYVLAIAVGAGAGAGAVVFRYLILGFTRFFSGHDDYSAAGRVPNPLVPHLGIWFVVLAPVAGGLIYGILIDRFAREARGHGVPEVMLAVAEHGGRIRPQVAVIKSLASALCIGSGGSVGREGPIVQIGSALGSTLGQWVRIPESRLRLLVACGAAGGISATFNAPIAGVFFGLELILRDFEVESFGVVVLASVLAAIMGRAAFGSHPFLELPAFALSSLWEYLLYAGLGVLATAVGLTFVRVLYGTEDLLDRLWKGPEWLRPAVGGVVLGALLLALPQMYGVGYPVLEGAIRGGYGLVFLLMLLIGKIAATSLTIGIGGSGGVFAPSLFMGAMLGTAYGMFLQHLLPGIVGPAGAYGLVGMGAVFAAAAQAPITSVLIIFELTGDYRIILPLMFAVVLATGLSTVLTRESIYTLKLRRRGIDIRRGRAANLMEVLMVEDAMQPVPLPLAEDVALNEMITRFTDEGWDALPVVDERAAFEGTVTARQVEQAMRDNALDATARDLAKETPVLSPRQSLEQALGLLVRHDASGLPVLDPDARRVIGWVTHRDVLRAYNERLESGVAQVEQRRQAVAPAAGTAPRPAILRGYRVIDLQLTRDQAPAGQRVRDIPWPPAALLLAIRRDGTSVVPTGDTRLQKGDRLAILVPAEDAETIVDAVGMDQPPPVRPTASDETAPRDVAIEALLSQSPRNSVVLEPTVTSGSAVEGKFVRDLGLEKGILLVAIRRGNVLFVPKGDARLEIGDHVVMIAPSRIAEHVLDRFRKPHAR
ncbi:MAG TPA: chloride channel protein [bacterium]|nr:chloride channel protein [bacterium]